MLYMQVEDALLREQTDQYNRRIRDYEERQRQRQFREEEEERRAEAEAEVVRALLRISEDCKS